jgi:hypothetical protein
MLHWLEPRFAELELHGKEFGDIVHIGSTLLVTSRFMEAYQKAGLVGLGEFSRIEIVRVKPKRGFPRCPEYFHVEVGRGRAALDAHRSGLICYEPATCKECRTTVIEVIASLQLEPDTWSGEDIFIARGLPGTNLVTDRFKAACEAFGITNVRFIPAAKYSLDFRSAG